METLEAKELLASIQFLDPGLYSANLSTTASAYSGVGVEELKSSDSISLDSNLSNTNSFGIARVIGETYASFKYPNPTPFADPPFFITPRVRNVGSFELWDIMKGIGNQRSAFRLNSSVRPDNVPGVITEVGSTSNSYVGRLSNSLYIAPSPGEELGALAEISFDATAAGTQASYSVRVGLPDGKEVILLDNHDSGQPGSDQAKRTFLARSGETYTFTLDHSFEYVVAEPGVSGSGVTLLISVRSVTDPGLTVTAEHDDDGREKIFGRYLEGIRLDTPFTVDAGLAYPEGYTVSYRVGGGVEQLASRVDERHWSFSINPGALPARTDEGHPLLVTLKDADGDTVHTFNGFLEVVDTLDFDLNATYPGGQDQVFDVEELRFLRNIELSPTFQGTVSGLPSYYQDRFTHLRLGIEERDRVEVSLVPNGFRSWTFSDVRDDMANLPAGTTDAALMFRTNEGGLTYRTSFGTAPLLAINSPAWMGTPLSKSYDEAVDAKVFGSETGAYAFTLAFPPALQFDLPDLEPSDLGPFGFVLDEPLTNDVGLGLTLTVYARPTIGADDTRVKAEDAFARVTLLDRVLLDQSKRISEEDLTIEATLEPKTLEALGTIRVTTKEVDLKALIPGLKPFELPFGDGTGNSWTIPLPGTFGLVRFTAEAKLNGKFEGQLVNLTGQLGVELDVSGPETKFVEDGTFIALAGNAFAELTATVQGGGGLTILPLNFTIPVATAALEGTVGANLAAVARVHFGGPLSSPTASFDEKNSLGLLNLYYQVSYDYAWFSDEVDPRTSGRSSSDVYPIVLFGTAASFQPNLEDSAGLNLIGPGNPAGLGYPGAQPTQGGTLVELGSTESDIQADQSSQSLEVSTQRFMGLAASVPMVSTLKVLSPLDDRTTSLTYDLNVLAGAIGLTPGSHWLEILLAGPDGQQEVPLDRVDLSSMMLTANDNPLGFSSGWTRPVLAIPSGLLAPARPYNLVFRLQTDHDATAERVAVLLDGLSLGVKTPRAVLSGPLGGLEDGRLDFGTDTADPHLGIIRLRNEGDEWLIVEPAALTGTGYTLVGLLASGFELAPGDQMDLQVRQVLSSASNPGRLTLKTNDPSRPSIELALVPAQPEAGNQPPVIQPITQRTVSEGMALVIPVSATDADSGQTLTYRLDPGAPTEASIDPISGVFTWTGAAPGQYTITVRVTDDGTPAESASRTFTITVNNIAPTLRVGSNTTIQQGGSLTRSGSFDDPGMSGTWTATVDYGDGTGEQPLSLNADRTFDLNHVYTTVGTHTVSIRVRDSYGGLGIAKFEVTVTDTQLDSTGPQVVRLSRSGLFRAPTVLSITFNEPIDVSQAVDARNYEVRLAGRDRRFGTADDVVIPIRSAQLSNDGRVVTLIPVRRLPFLATYQLVISGAAPGGITDIAGNLLDGNADGQPGGHFTQTFSMFGAVPSATRPLDRPQWRPLVWRRPAWRMGR